MSVNTSISYILYNKDIIVNLYKLHFPSFPFSFQPNKKAFHPPTFSPLQQNIHKEKLNLFYPPIFPSSHFSNPPTTRALRRESLLQQKGPKKVGQTCIEHGLAQFGREGRDNLH